MDIRKIAYFIGICVFLAAFLAISYIFIIPSVPVFNIAMSCDFNQALWIFRKMDILVQVMLIFTCALGIIVFFADKDGK